MDTCTARRLWPFVRMLLQIYMHELKIMAHNRCTNVSFFSTTHCTDIQLYTCLVLHVSVVHLSVVRMSGCTNVRLYICQLSLQWRHNERNVVSNHQPHDCLLNRLFKAQAEEITQPIIQGADRRKHQSSASLAFVSGIHRWPVNSPYKGPVTQKKLPFDDVIMVQLITVQLASWQTSLVHVFVVQVCEHRVGHVVTGVCLGEWNIDNTICWFMASIAVIDTLHAQY